MTGLALGVAILARVPDACRWPAIETALRAAVDTAGDMAAYRHRFERGRWWWLSTANSTVPAGRDLRQTCQ